MIDVRATTISPFDIKRHLRNYDSMLGTKRLYPVLRRRLTFEYAD